MARVADPVFLPGSGSGLAWEVGSGYGQYQTGSETLSMASPFCSTKKSQFEHTKKSFHCIVSLFGETCFQTCQLFKVGCFNYAFWVFVGMSEVSRLIQTPEIQTMVFKCGGKKWKLRGIIYDVYLFGNNAYNHNKLNFSSVYFSVVWLVSRSVSLS